VVAGESSEAGNPVALGMTKRGGSLQGKGGCWMKGQLLNRGILQIKFGQLFNRPCGTVCALEILLKFTGQTAGRSYPPSTPGADQH
jgi:hypothetical protein